MSPASEVEVVFYDVGQGDCSLFLDRQSAAGLLVDCPAGAARRVIRDIRSRGVRDLDVLVTHWDFDHYPGAVRVAQNYPARAFYFNIDTTREVDEEQRDRRQSALLAVGDLEAKPVQLRAAGEGACGDAGRCHWVLLAPSQGELLAAHNRNDRNHGSVVLSATYDERRTLVGGDADGQVWRRLIQSGQDMRAAVLRCSHHGGSLGQNSDAVDDEALLAAVQPETFVVSVGSLNRYGHPFQEVVHSARAVDARVLCTQATPRCAISEGSVTSCAGDVIVDLATGAVSPDHETHDVMLQQLVPMCQMNPRQD